MIKIELYHLIKYIYYHLTYVTFVKFICYQLTYHASPPFYLKDIIHPLLVVKESHRTNVF